MINASLEEFTFSNCSASFEQPQFPCKDAMQEGGKGWAYLGRLPAFITLQLENSTAEISQIELISNSIHANHWPTRFMIDFFKNGRWTRPTWLNIIEPSDAYYEQSTGEIEVVDVPNKKTVIKFDPITGVSLLRLNIFASAAHNGNAVIEQIKALGAFPQSEYHLQVPTPFG